MKYYKLSNSSGKQWIFPKKGIRVALELYQPSGKKGRLLKKFLPLIMMVDFLDWGKMLLSMEEVEIPVSEHFLKAMEDIFGGDELEYSFFLGTPGVHQKTTIQIFRGDKILGYCKVARTLELITLFEREVFLLRKLEESGLVGVPQCISFTQQENGECLFVQTTEKTLRSSIKHKWSQLHEDFLMDLYCRTKVEVAYNDTDLCRSVDYLLEHLSAVGDERRQRIVWKAIRRVEFAYKGKMVEVCVSHSDFTPWNIIEERGRLFVFDWEYASPYGFPCWDKFHFLIQTAVYYRRMSVDQIICFFETDDTYGEWENLLLTSYLLNIFSLYIRRGAGVLEEGLDAIAHMWCELLDYTNSYSES